MNERPSLRIETCPPVEIGIALWPMLRMAALGVIMTGGSALLGFRLIGDEPPGGFGQFIGLLGLVFFGLCTAVVFWRMVTLRGAVVTLTSEGIRDERIAKAFVPWTAIRRISTWSSHGQTIMVLAIDPVVEAKLPLSRIAAWSRNANRRLGADGLCIAASGLAVSHETLLSMTRAYLARHA